MWVLYEWGKKWTGVLPRDLPLLCLDYVRLLAWFSVRLSSLANCQESNNPWLALSSPLFLASVCKYLVYWDIRLRRINYLFGQSFASFCSCFLTRQAPLVTHDFKKLFRRFFLNVPSFAGFELSFCDIDEVCKRYMINGQIFFRVFSISYIRARRCRQKRLRPGCET